MAAHVKGSRGNDPAKDDLTGAKESRQGPEPERLKIDGMEWDEAVRKVLKKNDPPKKRAEPGNEDEPAQGS